MNALLYIVSIFVIAVAANFVLCIALTCASVLIYILILAGLGREIDDD